MYIATKFQFQFGIGQVSLNINVILVILKLTKQTLNRQLQIKQGNDNGVGFILYVAKYILFSFLPPAYITGPCSIEIYYPVKPACACIKEICCVINLISCTTYVSYILGRKYVDIT